MWVAGTGEPPRARSDHVARPGLGQACSQHYRRWCGAQDPRPCCGYILITAAQKMVSTLSREKAGALQEHQLEVQKTNKKRECPETPGPEALANLNSSPITFLGRNEKREKAQASGLGGDPQPARGTAQRRGIAKWWGICILKLGYLKTILQERSHHV